MNYTLLTEFHVIQSLFKYSTFLPWTTEFFLLLTHINLTDILPRPFDLKYNQRKSLQSLKTQALYYINMSYFSSKTSNFNTMETTLINTYIFMHVEK